MIRPLYLWLTLYFSVLSGPIQAQPNNEAYLDLLLFSQFGEFCTMCEAVLICEDSSQPPSYEAIPEQGSFTLYHIETRTFWSQIATIWEWFINNFKEEPISGHHRPVNVIEVANGNWTASKAYSLHIDIDPPYLTIDSWQIQRRTSEWLNSGESSGYCQRLPLWDALETIEANVPQSTMPQRNASGGQS